MLSLSIDDVSPHLRTLTEPESQVVEVWVQVASAILNARYGEKITFELEGVFTYYVAEAIKRKLTNKNPHVLSESVEGASVTYAASSTKGDWFLPSELSEMDTLAGRSRPGIIRFSSPRILG